MESIQYHHDHSVNPVNNVNCTVP